MVISKTLASVLAELPSIKLMARAFEPDDEISFGESAPPAEDAEIVEGDTLRAIPVQAAVASGFTHFADGAQKTRLAFYDGQMPGYLAFLNAAILKRENGDMLESDEYREEESIFLPENSAAARLLVEAGWQIRTAACPPDSGMSALRECVCSRISSIRDGLESTVKAAWLRGNKDGWLLCDGGIAQAAAAVGTAIRLVGVVKSHRKQYFCARVAAEVVLNLRAGERTSVFVARSGNMGRDIAYSWYLRLREERNESPVFGLVRVEMPPREECLPWVGEVSAWLMAERCPLSLPDVRFDRMAYPIRRVELYLRSRQPSDAAFSARLGIF